MFDNKYFNSYEIKIFSADIKKHQYSKLISDKAYEKCVARALCKIGSNRRTPICGNYASQICELLTRTLKHEYSAAELKRIINYCMDETIEKNIETAETYCGKDTMKRLSKFVPVFMSRSRKLTDFLNDAN